MVEVSIIDYGIGNLGSILNMYRKLGVAAERVSSPEAVLGAKRLILPGIGAFDACARSLEESGLRPGLLAAVAAGTPLLGICVGMQLLTNGSEEGTLPGLGLVDAETRRFPASPGIKVPHMGWSSVHWQDPGHPLASGLVGDVRFYFVHSYYVRCSDPVDSLASATHGLSFSAAIRSGNAMGVQFHPEKSHKFGLQLLRNFSKI